MLVADPLQARCCTTSRSRVSAAAPIPVPTPVNRTANQKRTASGDWSVEGMMLPAAVGKDPGVVNFMGIFPQLLPWSGNESYHIAIKKLTTEHPTEGSSTGAVALEGYSTDA